MWSLQDFFKNSVLGFSLITDFCKIQLISGFQKSFLQQPIGICIISVIDSFHCALKDLFVPNSVLTIPKEEYSVINNELFLCVFFILSAQVWKWCAALQGASRWGWQVFPLGGEVQFFERAGRLSQIHICLQEPANISPGHWTGATGKRSVLVECTI